MSNEEYAEILAMCEDEYNPSPEDEPGLSRSSTGFDMGGSTINIDRSKGIHIGPKTVTSVPPPSVASSSSLYSQESNCSNADSGSMISSSLSSLNSQFQTNLNASSTFDSSSECSFESCRLSEVFSGTPTSFKVNLGSTPQPNPIAKHPHVGGKSVSSPIGDHNSCSSLSNINAEFQTVPHLHVNSPTNAREPQLSAAINNSSNVQMGTQIVYNYYRYASEPETHHQSGLVAGSTSNVPYSLTSESESPKDYLLEFREKLASVYQKRSKSSILPWHRGQQIPINEYYTEPQIFAFDNCGRTTTDAVNLITILNSNSESRFLVEGEAGMGKTLLATKLAEEWASGVNLKQFQILILITLGDFKGSLQQYVREELLPSYFESDKFDRVWEYCKSHEREILFILDGFDELERLDKGEIHNLLRSKDFPESKVLVTSRPNILRDWEKKIVVCGFGQIQVMEFIKKYFKVIGNESRGQALMKLIEKDDKYWNLAKRPLFCVLLCMLCITTDVGESLPKRQSDVMLQIILCLIKWNGKNQQNAAVDFDALPQKYEKPFCQFGKLCLNALRTEKSRFTDLEVKSVEGFESKLQQLGFLFNDNERHALGERTFWKPVHQTFLEYLGAFHMAKHLRECKSCKECKGYDSIFQRSPEVLKFCVGILNHKAYKLLDGQRFPVLWKIPMIKLLQLLKEAETKQENCLAIAKLLDQTTVEVSTSEIEFEGWSCILSQPFRRLTTLKIAWRIKSTSPDQESSFTEATQSQYKSFFEALNSNESIQTLHVRAKQDGEPFTDEKIAMFFSHLQTAFAKKNLQELQIVEMKMKASGHLRSAIEKNLGMNENLKDLRLLKIHTFMADKDLMGICDALHKVAPKLESLHLEGLEHGNAGFQSLVKLLKTNKNIKQLHLSMNQSLFVNVFESNIANKEDYTPVHMRTDHQRMNRTAGRKSKNAFSESFDDPEDKVNSDESHNRLEESSRRTSNENSSRSPISSGKDPRKELNYLFDKLEMNSGQWHVEARHHWFLRKSGSELRVPLPVCIEREHKSVFHFLFSAIPDTHISVLKLSQAGLYLTTADLICLGQAVRKSAHLTTLNLPSLDKVESYLPLLIGIGQSPALSSVSITSSKVILNDVAFEVVCASLQNNASLRHLSIGRWQFNLHNPSLAYVHLKNLLESWQVTHLDLKQCCIDMTEHCLPETPSSPTCIQPLSAFFSKPPESQTQPWGILKTIALEGVELKESNGLVRRGHLILPGLVNFTNLTLLDLSVSPAKSIQVDNVAARRFFGLIGNHMKQLVELKLDNWEFCLRAFPPTEGGQDLAESLKNCRKLRKVQLESVNEIINDQDKNVSIHSWCKLTFLHQLISFAPQLETLSLCYYKINKGSFDTCLASKLGSCLRDHWHHTPFSVKFFKLSPEVDNIIYNALKKKPYKVNRSSGPSLLKTYNVRNFLVLKKRPR